MNKGKVFLIGAGPGDYKLITIKGLECIQKADVVLYDRLASPRLLSFAKENAEMIYVGKAPNNHAYTQDEINELILQKALEGKVVARLKGGDPYVFGRGGEEAKVLKDHGVHFEIVPGITSSIAVPSYAGIPVTHRNVSSSFHVITGNEDPTKEENVIDYEALAKVEGTLIFLMGIKNLDKICSSLIKFGQDPNRPVAVIMRGTTANQKMAKGTLSNIYQMIKENNIQNPSIIIVGEVVNLSETLNWFENKPLFGKKILVTRTRTQASVLSEQLEDLGANAIEFPTIQIEKPKDYTKIDEAIKQIQKYKWIIFTSVNGVHAFFERLKELKLDVRSLYGAKLVAIGTATQKVLEDKGLLVEYVPEVFRAEAIVEGLKDKINKGDHILLPRADIARTILIEELEKMHAIVDHIDIYHTTIPNSDREKLVHILQEGIDFITFTSSSTAKNFIAILGEENKELLKDIKIAVIGPITAQTVKDIGMNVDISADEFTIDGLVNSILKWNE
ncbi:uroporphyrinogen-III C-methyltransferase [Inediibacterium massiliense]|uniref:uroporphyrinogen-III C-methyltransferase n=1 Tax=Inediibacterium massiliense TaxID=1658111 RepID=UPI0006B41753|nr:uroporphyrinogen-III C-methyltransferase [Inediibacterium massiliense]